MIESKKRCFSVSNFMSDKWTNFKEDPPTADVRKALFNVINEYGNPYITIAYSIKRFTELANDEICYAEDFGEVNPEDDELYCPEGWFAIGSCDEEIHYLIKGKITHWQRLPEPVKEGMLKR